jgi:hypothetical protein
MLGSSETLLLRLQFSGRLFWRTGFEFALQRRQDLLPDQPIDGEAVVAGVHPARAAASITIPDYEALIAPLQSRGREKNGGERTPKAGRNGGGKGTEV